MKTGKSGVDEDVRGPGEKIHEDTLRNAKKKAE